MADEVRQEMTIEDFSRGIDVRQDGSAQVLKRTPNGELPHTSGVMVEEDGTLSCVRNQFRIPGVDHVDYSGTLAHIMEYVSDEHNQLVVIDDAGEMFATGELDWVNETPAQWNYGYELFSTPAWTNPADLVDTGRYDFANVRNRLYMANDGRRLSYYDGSDVKYVGIVPPVLGFGTEQDLTTWTESDTGGYFTVAAGSIAVADMPLTADEKVYDSVELDDFSAVFTVTVAATSDAGSEAYVLQMVYSAMNMRVAIQATASDFDLVLEEEYAPGDVEVRGSIEDLSLDTAYYCKLSRSGNQIQLEVFSDSGMSVRVGAVGGDKVIYGEFTECRAVSGTSASSGTEAIDMTIADLYITDITVSTSGSLPVGTYTYILTFGNEDFESHTGVEIDVVVSADGSTIELSGIETAPTASGQEQQAAWRKIYRAYTASTETGARGSEYALLNKIDDNTTTEYDDNAPQSYLSTGIPYDRAIPPQGDILAHFKETMFMAGITKTSISYSVIDTENLQNILFYSEVGVPNYWPGDNWVEVGDSTPIVALVQHQDYLVVIKTSSVFLVSMRSGTLIMRQIDDKIGATDPCHVASDSRGVAWTAPQGVVLYSGEQITTLLEFTPDNPYECPTGNYSALAIHKGKLHYMSGELLRFDLEDGHWENTGVTQASEIGGIQSFTWGIAQSHLLLYADWATGVQELTILDPAEYFANGDGEGTLSNTDYAAVKVTLPVVTAPPGKNLWLQEVWVDGEWTGTVDLYINDDGTYSSSKRGDAPQDGRGQFNNPNYYGDHLYVQFAGNNVPDFHLRSIRLVFVIMNKRVRPYA